MKITYTPNPLNTSIELDEHEKKELWHKVKAKELMDRLFLVHYELKYQDKPDMARITKAVDPTYYLDGDEEERSGLDSRTDLLLDELLAALIGPHCGDCVCVACSCSKCQAESLLGVDTIKGLRKHEAAAISSAFRRLDADGNRLADSSIDEAIERLRNFDPKPPTDPAAVESWARAGGFEKHIPRWKAENAQALRWLETYRAENFLRSGVREGGE